MKTSSQLALILSLAVSGLAVAQPADMKSDHMSAHVHAASVSTGTYSAVGVVKKIDAAKGTVAFAHAAIPALNWPAMTMNFSVKDKALLNKLKVGKKATLEFQQQGSDNIVTAVR
jgi:Cu(I)/Ag(I) efflux system periplasmic protein CusF